MSDVRWADAGLQQAEEKRQLEKSDAEKRQSHEAFEKRLQHDRGTRESTARQVQHQARNQAAAQETRTQRDQQAEAQQATQHEDKAAQAKKQQTTKGQALKKAVPHKPAPAGHGEGVLAQVRAQAQAQQAKKAADARLGKVGQEAAEAGARELQHAAQHSEEQGAALGSRRQDGLNSGRTQEKSRAQDLDRTDRTKEADAKAARAEEKDNANNAQAAGSQPQQAAGNNPNTPLNVDADAQRQKQRQQEGNQQGGGGQAQEAQAAKGPSKSAIERANKAQEIQKLCEKLLDNFFMGCAPDGSAMMRMELKEGVLAGLVIDLKVDDKRQVSLTLSGNKEAADFVTASRGDLAKALTKRGLQLKEVKTG